MQMILSQIRYVYFIKIYGRIIYIGRSDTPIARIRQHSQSLLKGIDTFKVEVYGPYYYIDANELEASEIYRRKNNKNLLSNTTKKHGNINKKISVKNFGSKTVFEFRKEGKAKKMVCKHAD